MITPLPLILYLHLYVRNIDCRHIMCTYWRRAMKKDKKYQRAIRPRSLRPGERKAAQIWIRFDATTNAELERLVAEDEDEKGLKPDWTRGATRFAPAKQSVHLRLEQEIIAFFKSQGKGHISRMQAVLKAYVEAHRERSKWPRPENTRVFKVPFEKGGFILILIEQTKCHSERNEESGKWPLRKPSNLSSWGSGATEGSIVGRTSRFFTPLRSVQNDIKKPGEGGHHPPPPAYSCAFLWRLGVLGWGFLFSPTTYTRSSTMRSTSSSLGMVSR